MSKKVKNKKARFSIDSGFFTEKMIKCDKEWEEDNAINI